MSKLVFDATGKYIHPTRYRQIVENGKPQSAHQRGAKDFVGRPETQFCGCQSSLSKAEIARSCREGSQIGRASCRERV